MHSPTPTYHLIFNSLTQSYILCNKSHKKQSKCLIMMSGNRNRFPFTGRQWEELEQQALIFKYMVSGFPVPPQLLFSIKIKTTTLDSLSLFSHPPPQQHFGWKCYGGKKVDPEPGRCRRTDGKKWRCSKEAYPDSKYCERHMHRGKNSSRKPVEVHSNSRPCLDNTNLLYSHHTNTTSYGTATASLIHLHGLSPSAPQNRAPALVHSVEDDQELPKKTVHCFFDEWPPQNRDKSPTRLSISIPTSSLHFHTPQY